MRHTFQKLPYLFQMLHIDADQSYFPYARFTINRRVINSGSRSFTLKSPGFSELIFVREIFVGGAGDESSKEDRTKNVQNHIIYMLHLLSYDSIFEYFSSHLWLCVPLAPK